MSCAVIIPAGGIGKRFGGDIPKQFAELGGIPILIHTLRIFENMEEITSVILPVHSDWYKMTGEMVTKYNIEKVTDIVIGGKIRQESVINGLRTDTIVDTDIVLVHDAVRPCASPALIRRIIETAEEYGAAIPVLKPGDTIKERNSAGAIVKTLDRSKLCMVQTPQGFWKELLVSAYLNAEKAMYEGSDSAMLVEFLGYKVQVVEGEETNLKITTPFDMKVAEMVLNGQIA